ncbi:putative polyketide protein [Diplocarpon rosae]|nr:putative polyketide protein [Diplocarpon rosae]
MACRLPGGIDSDSSFWSMLVEKRTGQTARVPESRFNIDAHYHETLDRPGSFNVAGGYFLDGRPEDFDPTFFGMTPVEAQWLDPQQRRILEVSYECLASAGVTLEAIAGTNTAVFVGSFTSDYQQMSIRDPDFRHNYAATGVDTGIISNRIGNTFNLNGPSFTINTACSSSIYALHLACQSLRNRDCTAAIVSGVNLVITVDQHANTAKLGILSPTSTCHTFDASADGYGRAEGAGALYIKRLSDAIRDGDPIRGVVRSTAVNTNGKVDGMGITHPSVKGQERVVRMAYEKANLDPNLTVYAELHGTGTPVGDPIEVLAVSRALNDNRPKDKPLLIGAVKPNIGHSEAASGIFAVMKASLMTEASTIPGVALFNKLNPAILEDKWNVKVHANTAPWPKDSAIRRASVSSFGYGGTNGHAIIESVESLYPWYQHAKAKKDSDYDRSSEKAFLLCISGHDKTTLARNVAALGRVASNYYLTDLAHTLNLHRTKFSHRAFTVAREGQEAEAFAPSAVQTGVAPKNLKHTEIGFLFTGQGAQWLGMGKIALQEFPVMLDTIQRLDQVLARLDPKPSFRIEDMLLGESSVAAKRINDAEVSQPLCTAIQIALVDLFSMWDISPQVSIGHSSGEIGAAYAAGLIAAPEAIAAAFCRGRAVAQTSAPGSMLAVGLGPDVIQEHLLPETDVCIACENSPNSVTLSGPTKCIVQLQEKLSAKGVFARELKTGRAYHSPYMAPVSNVYDEMLKNALHTLSEDDLLWRRSRSQMISSVTGELVSGNDMPPAYWSANLRQRVLFNTAVQSLVTDSAFENVRLIIEIGPHAALSGPFKQICSGRKLDRFTYVPTFVRNKNDQDQLLSVAGSVFIAGYPVDLEEVNSTFSVRGSNSIRKPNTRRLLVDLPPYQWNYEKKYWAEPRASAEQRARVYPRHDLLGSRISGLSTQTKVWRNILRHRDVPWLKDHNLGGTSIFPAAGHLSLAIEALRQSHETEGQPFEGVTIRDVDIKTALVVPENDDGVETIFSLQSPSNDSGWHTFSVESLTDNIWTLHCAGKILAAYKPIPSRGTPVVEIALTQTLPGRKWYNAFDRVGFYYGPTFQQLESARTNCNLNQATGNVKVLESSGVIDGESRYLVHPSTVDACLQLIIVSIHAGKHKEMPWGVVPTRIEEISLFPARDDVSTIGHAVAWTDELEQRRFNTHVRLTGSNGRVLVDVKNLTCVTYDAALPAGATTSGTGPEPFSTVSWKQDFSALNTSDLERLLPANLDRAERFVRMLELISHRHPVRDVMVCGFPSTDDVDKVFVALPRTARLTIGLVGEQELNLSEEVQLTAIMKNLGVSPDDFLQSIDEPFDIVIDFSRSETDTLPETLLPLVKDGGWVLGSAEKISIGQKAIQCGAEFALTKAGPHINGVTAHEEKITILSLSDVRHDQDLVRIVSPAADGRRIEEKYITKFSQAEDELVVVDDRIGTLFALMSADATIFNAVKTVLTAGVRILWLTRGVKEGKSPAAGMAEGFLRAIRSEQASARIVLLDTDYNSDPMILGATIVSKLDSAATKDSSNDLEFWLHEGSLHICRIYPADHLNQETSKTQTSILPRGLPLKLQSIDGDFSFEPEILQPGDVNNMVSLQILASEFQASNQGRLLVCGTIVSAAADSTLVGRRAIAFSDDGLHTILHTSAYVVVGKDVKASSEVLVQALLPLLPLISLSSIGTSLEQQHVVLSMPGPNHVMDMMRRLADAFEWKLLIIVNSSKEGDQYVAQLGYRPEQIEIGQEIAAVSSIIRRHYASSGPLSIVAHDFSLLSEEIWRNIPPACKFILSEASIAAAPDSLPFGRGASFICSNTKVLRASPHSASELLRSSLHLVAKHPALLHSTADTTVKIVNLDHVHGLLHTGAERDTSPSALHFRYGEDKIEILPETKQLRLSPDASYLLVGCLGGLGRSLTKRMMDRGAKHFAFISRSGADKPEAAELLQNIQNAGASVKIYRADASDEAAVKKIVHSLNAERTVRGVIHAAMVLKDGMFEQMSHNSFADSVNPKAKGALSLHKALGNLDLDFFVMTSSISALLGNTGQSNYSAANSVLDALALQRNTLHLAASSLVLPMVLGVGVVAENAAIEISLARKGLYGVDEDEMLRGFEIAMSHPISNTSQTAMTSQIIMGMEAQELAKSMTSTDNLDAYWYDDVRFCHIRQSLDAIITGSQVSKGGSDNNFAALLKTAVAEGPDAVTDVVAQHIVKRVSGILMISVEDFDLDGPSLASYGLDSMIGAEMRTWLFKEFSLDYPFQLLLAPTLTFQKLARVVAEKMELVPALLD